MKTRIAVAAALAMSIAAFGCWSASRHVAAAQTQGNARIAGVWRGQMDGLPALTLNVSYESGSLNGAILFYLLRKEPGKAETATAGVPEPLMDARFDGTTLTFAVSHRRAHPPASADDAPVRFTIKLTGANKAELLRDNDSAPGLEIDRD